MLRGWQTEQCNSQYSSNTDWQQDDSSIFDSPSRSWTYPIHSVLSSHKVVPVQCIPIIVLVLKKQYHRNSVTAILCAEKCSCPAGLFLFLWHRSPLSLSAHSSNPSILPPPPTPRPLLHNAWNAWQLLGRTPLRLCGSSKMCKVGESLWEWWWPVGVRLTRWVTQEAGAVWNCGLSHSFGTTGYYGVFSGRVYYSDTGAY